MNRPPRPQPHPHPHPHPHLPPVAAGAFPPSHLNFSQPPLPPPPAPPSLSDALSNLTSLLHLSTTALRSLPAPISTAASHAASHTFIQCPFNPNHRLPPSSLFLHYLKCPSASPLSLLHTYQDSQTLQSSTSMATKISISTDISLSLECPIANSGNLFYENCPGPVTHSTRLPSLLNLPKDLSVECVDFSEDPSAKEAVSFSLDHIRFLPSEICAIRSETEAWGGDFPVAYTSRTLRAVLRLRDCKLLRLNLRILSSSPRYGVIIDVSLNDHVALLVTLCLKAIVREAFVAGVVLFGNGNVSNQSLECPVLAKAMAWLALQLCVLYGEVNGKLFAVDVLRECILDSASHASLFHLEQEEGGFSDLVELDCEGQEHVPSILASGGTQIDEGESVKGKTVGNRTIIVSQVVAAVVALNERSMIEEKVKALRNPRPIPAYERNMEHAYLSKMADEERAKRPEYKPVIEHDGFLWQKSNNQESNNIKTREELLAEERDYKRRRMSYRGKKSKRNTLEVTRDIIDEYMEEIRRAGGTGNVSEDVEKTDALGSENSYTHAIIYNASKSRKHLEIPEKNKDRSPNYRKEFHTASHENNAFEDDIQWTKREASRDSGHQDRNKSFSRNKQDTDYYSSRRDGRSHKRRGESREHKHHNRNRDRHEEGYNHERERDECERSSHNQRERHEGKREHGDKRERKRNTNHSSSYRAHCEFDDRYDPAPSRESYEDDF